MKLIYLIFVFHLQGGANEAVEQRMSAVGTALELRVELAAYEPGMIWIFHDFHQPFVRRQTGQK